MSRHSTSWLLLGALAAVGFAIVVYLRAPRSVSSATELSSLVGRNVRLIGTFDGDHKPCDVVYFDNSTVPIYQPLGLQQTPKTGQQVSVTGELERRSVVGFANTYIIKNAVVESEY